MNEAIAVALESQLFHGIVEGALGDASLEDEVCILRSVGLRVNRHASAASQNGADAATSEVLADDDGDLREGRRAGQLHKGLPARRGRRRRPVARCRTSASACAIRDRNASSSLIPKYLGFSE